MSPLKRLSQQIKTQASERPLILLPWYLILVWRPDMALALNDSQGKAHFGKRAAVVAFTVDAFILIWGMSNDRYPPWPHFLLMNVAIYGMAGLHMFFNHTRLSISAKEVDEKVRQEIVTRRAAGDGSFEPTP